MERCDTGMEMFRIQCKMGKNEFYWLIGGILGAYLLGTGIWSAVSAGDDGMVRAFPLGTVIAVFGTVVAHLIGCTYNMLSAFGLSVSMGATRKQFVRSYAAFGMLELILACVLIRVLYGLEKIYYLKVFGLPVYEMAGLSAVGYPVLSVCTIAGLIAIEMFCGALILKFGVKAVAGLWLFFMAICYLPGILLRTEFFSGLLSAARSGGENPLTVPGILAVFAFACAAMFFAAWGMLRRQQVNG